MDRSDLLELINSVECSTGRKQLYYLSHHSLINLTIDYFKDSDVIVIDSKNDKQYQRGNEIKTK